MDFPRETPITTLVPHAEMVQRLHGISMTSNNQQLRQRLFGTLLEMVESLRLQGEPLSDRTLAFAIMTSISKYTERMTPLEKKSFAMILGPLLHQMVNAMINDEKEQGNTLSAVVSLISLIMSTQLPVPPRDLQRHPGRLAGMQVPHYLSQKPPLAISTMQHRHRRRKMVGT